MITAFPSTGQAVRFIKTLVSRGVSPAEVAFVGDFNESYSELATLLDNFATLTIKEGRILLVAGVLASKASLVTGCRLTGLFVDYEIIAGEREQLTQWVMEGKSLVVVGEGCVEGNRVVGPKRLWAWPEQPPMVGVTENGLE